MKVIDECSFNVDMLGQFKFFLPPNTVVKKRAVFLTIYISSTFV